MGRVHVDPLGSPGLEVFVGTMAWPIGWVGVGGHTPHVNQQVMLENDVSKHGDEIAHVLLRTVTLDDRSLNRLAGKKKKKSLTWK